jgi:adenylate kinase family enzyme
VPIEIGRFELLEKLTKEIADLLDRKPTPVILIDGRACTGKSTFATELSESLYKAIEVLPRLVHMDDLYPGWEGLRAGSNYLNQQVLGPIANGKTSRWQVWDWSTGTRGRESEPGNGWREFSGGIPLIVEGCGSLSRTTLEMADFSVWLEADLQIRKSRWQERDLGKFDDKFAIWTSQEDEFYAAEKPELLAKWLLKT